jgi:hypothetical protein
LPQVPNVFGSTYPLFASDVVAGFPTTTFFDGIPRLMIYLTEVALKYPSEFVKRSE